MPGKSRNTKTKFVPFHHLDTKSTPVATQAATKPQVNAWVKPLAVKATPIKLQTQPEFRPTDFQVPMSQKRQGSQPEVSNATPKVLSASDLALKRQIEADKDLKAADQKRSKKKLANNAKESAANQKLDIETVKLSNIGVAVVDSDPVVRRIVYPGEKPKEPSFTNREYRARKSDEDIHEALVRRILARNPSMLYKGESPAMTTILRSVERDLEMIASAARGTMPMQEERRNFGRGYDSEHIRKLDQTEAPLFSEKLNLMIEAKLKDVTLDQLSSALDLYLLSPEHVINFFVYFEKRGDKGVMMFRKKYLSDFGMHDYDDCTDEEMAFMHGKIYISSDEADLARRKTQLKNTVTSIGMMADSEIEAYRNLFRVSGMIGFLESGHDAIQDKIDDQKRFNQRTYIDDAMC
jgi:hypothetical protein